MKCPPECACLTCANHSFGVGDQACLCSGAMAGFPVAHCHKHRMHLSDERCCPDYKPRAERGEGGEHEPSSE